jgi:TatD DNase family protein
MPFVDVHTHLTHDSFAADLPQVVGRARAAGVTRIVTNGTDGPDNRRVLEMAASYPEVLPALGIYPVDAIANEILAGGHELPWQQQPLDVDAELAFIDAHAEHAAAIGECGLDAHWVPDYMARQEEVFTALIEIARSHDRPLIVHSRRAEAETLAVLQRTGATRVDFHCFGGKFNLARAVCEAGYYCSIPANVGKNQLFQKMARELPLDRLLTETDAPYLAPERGTRNEPANVPGTVAAIAELRGLPLGEVEAAIEENFRRLFQIA